MRCNSYMSTALLILAMWSYVWKVTTEYAAVSAILDKQNASVQVIQELSGVKYLSICIKGNLGGCQVTESERPLLAKRPHVPKADLKAMQEYKPSPLRTANLVSFNSVEGTI